MDFFSQGIQFLTTGIGGIAFGFYASWQVAFVVLAMLPVVAFAAMSLLALNQGKSARSAASYKRAGAVAYTSVSSIKTVLSLNAIPKMIDLFTDATQEAYDSATSVLIKLGLANGTCSRNEQ
jgi:ATP-binding cassette, subfamily B (MDR/TAP), member 1